MTRKKAITHSPLPRKGELGNYEKRSGNGNQWQCHSHAAARGVTTWTGSLPPGDGAYAWQLPRRPDGPTPTLLLHSGHFFQIRCRSFPLTFLVRSGIPSLIALPGVHAHLAVRIGHRAPGVGHDVLPSATRHLLSTSLLPFHSLSTPTWAPGSPPGHLNPPSLKFVSAVA